MTTEMKIKYTEYPECMFAIIAACLPANEGREVRLLAGEVFFRSEDNQGRTYRNGLLHSFNDEPARVINDDHREWYKDGYLHREGDLPAIITRRFQQWWVNGRVHRENNLPAFINGDYEEWWENGILIRYSENAPQYDPADESEPEEYQEEEHEEDYDSEDHDWRDWE